MNQMSCSPNDGFWGSIFRRLVANYSAAHFAKFTFGTATITEPVSIDLQSFSIQNGGWGVDENLADAYFFMTSQYNDNNEGWVTDQGLHCMMRNDLTYEYLKFEDPDRNWAKTGLWTNVYLGTGVYVVFQAATWGTVPITNPNSGVVGIVAALEYDDTRVSTPGVFDNECNPTYGWNVSAWEKHHAGMKPTHVAAEVLMDGLTIAFDDAAGTTDFQTTDFYTTCVYNGIVSDGSTTFEQILTRYQKPSTVETVLEAGVLPATTRVPPYFTEFQPLDVSDYQDIVGSFTYALGHFTKSTGVE